jgi:predicted RNase H-like HicB family nuclease
MAIKKHERIRYLVTLREAEEGGYTVEVPALPGCVCEGSSYEEAWANIREAITAYVAELGEDLNSQARVLITEIEVELPATQTAVHG